jgi:hypothetical protein
VTLLVVVLLGTNLVTLAVLLRMTSRRGQPRADDAEVFVCPRPAGVTGGTRRVISLEILNPIELVSARGRVAGLAGSLVPGLARRVVYDQTLKTLRRQLADKQVLADIRLHTLRPAPKPAPVRATPSIAAQDTALGDDSLDAARLAAGYDAAAEAPPEPSVDTVTPIDLAAVDLELPDDLHR